MRFIFENPFPKYAMSERAMNELMDKDIELCRSANVHHIDAVVHALLVNQIPFTRRTVVIPFFMRKRFHNISEIHQIYIHPRCYVSACRALNEMPYNIKRRVLLSH